MFGQKRGVMILDKKYLIMMWELSVAKFRLRDQGTFLGFIWTLLHPLIYFLVLYGLFRNWMGRHIDNFPLYLIIGIVQWNFFVSATSNSITAIMSAGSYIKNIKFPREILVLSSVLTVLFSHFLELLILIVFWILVGERIGWMVLGLFPVLLLNIYLVTAVSFILATVGVYFLDIGRIWGILANVGLFLTPIFYSMNLLAPDKRRIILLNPMTHIIQASRDILIDNKLPELKGLFYVFAVASVLLFLGYKFFKRNEGYFAERVM